MGTHSLEPEFLIVFLSFAGSVSEAFKLDADVLGCLFFLRWDPATQVLVPRTISVQSQLQTMLGKREGSVGNASQEVTPNRD